MSGNDEHLTHDLLLQFVNGEVPTQRFVEAMYRHLRSVCEVCRDEFILTWTSLRTGGRFERWVKSTFGRFPRRSTPSRRAPRPSARLLR